MSLTVSPTAHVQTLLTGLRSPMNHKTGCPFNMFKCCCLIGRRGDKPSSELLRASLQFLLRPETDIAHNALRDRLLSCQCRIYDSRTTPRATLNGIECLDLFIEYLCDMIREELRGLRPAKFRTRKDNRAACRQPWPNSPADIGLGGGSCHDLVERLLRRIRDFCAARKPGALLESSR
ncbi:hypothetical protein B0H13DRAFT_2537316 [Mycena leptocephala]|nr:hypothetical protein B0H13DRAFT_2537316 [Mycena leptocephala]